MKSLTKCIRWNDWLLTIGLLIMLFIAAYSLEYTQWAENLNKVTALAILGGILGIMIGNSSFHKKTTCLLIVLYSVVVLSWQLIFTLTSEVSWLENIQIFRNRINITFYHLLNNIPLEDSILFFIFSGFFYWIMSVWAGFGLVRKRRPWLPLLICGILLIVTQFFQPNVYRSVLISGGFIFLFIMLIGRMNFLKKNADWLAKNATIDLETRVGISRTVLAASLILVVCSWSIPYLTKVLTRGTKEQQQIAQKFENTWQALENFLAPLHQRPLAKESQFGDILSLGLGQPLGEDVLFAIIAPSEDFFDGRYFWRARIYDTYENGEWSNSDLEEKIIDAGSSLYDSQIKTSENNPFIVVASQEINYFYTINSTFSINQQGRVYYNEHNGETEIIATLPITRLQENDTYQFQANPTMPFYEELEAEVSNYPEWVKEKYLQIPDPISDQIKIIATEITNDIDNPFEKVMEITNYLRKEIQYTTEIEEIPNNKDPIEWVLLDGKKGFCNYSASAEVMLLRALGIPARLVVGYAQGREIEKGKVFEVQIKDSHAWPEVFFPNHGWIIFEPTSAQPQIQFPRMEIESNNVVGDFNGISGGEAFTEDLQLGDTLRRYEAIENRLLAENQFGQSIPSSEKNKINVGLIIFFVFLMGSILFLVFGHVKLHEEKLPVVTWVDQFLREKGINSPKWLHDLAFYFNLSSIQKTILRLSFYANILDEKRINQRTPKEIVGKLTEYLPINERILEQFLTMYYEEVYKLERKNWKLKHLDEIKILYSIIKQLFKKTRKEKVELNIN